MSATPVAPLAASVSDACRNCGLAATWQVSVGARSCTRCVGLVLKALYEAEPRPFAPYLPVPLKRGKW